MEYGSILRWHYNMAEWLHVPCLRNGWCSECSRFRRDIPDELKEFYAGMVQDMFEVVNSYSASDFQ